MAIFFLLPDLISFSFYWLELHICQHAGFVVPAAAGKLAGTRRELAGWMARMPFLESPNVDGCLGSASLGFS